MSHEYCYDERYAQKYIELTLASPYTVYKNKVIANLCKDLCAGCRNVVWDFGGNVSGIMRQEGSLRFQLEKVGLEYRAIDLVLKYFDSDFALRLGVDSSKIYAQLIGIVGDMQRLPLAPNSLEFVVSADVIEHVPNPCQAIKEISEALKKGGRAIIVVPSLYKLDAIAADYIEKKRYSSHENKLTLIDWQRLIQENGLKIDEEKSKPLGILSGLLYAGWLDERCVPSRISQEKAENFSPQATVFKQVKAMICRLDPKFDQLFLSKPSEAKPLINLLQTGRISELLKKIKEIVQNELSTDELKMFNQLIDIISEDQINQLALKKLMTLAQENNSWLGNSTLLVCQKE